MFIYLFRDFYRSWPTLTDMSESARNSTTELDRTQLGLVQGFRHT